MRVYDHLYLYFHNRVLWGHNRRESWRKARATMKAVKSDRLVEPSVCDCSVHDITTLGAAHANDCPMYD